MYISFALNISVYYKLFILGHSNIQLTAGNELVKKFKFLLHLI